MSGVFLPGEEGRVVESNCSSKLDYWEQTYFLKNGQKFVVRSKHDGPGYVAFSPTGVDKTGAENGPHVDKCSTEYFWLK